MNGESAVAVSELSDRDLDAAIFAALPSEMQAELTCDWCEGTGKSIDEGFNCEICDGAPTYHPFHKSVDLLEPVEARLREAGWDLKVEVLPDGRAKAVWTHRDCILPPHMGVQAIASNEKRARAEATYEALNRIAAALNSPTPTAKGDA